MRKIVKNSCYGGFCLSQKAYEELGIPWDGYGYGCGHDLQRDDPKLVAAVEKLGKAANGKYASLVVVSIPDDISWTIIESSGIETIKEAHRTW